MKPHKTPITPSKQRPSAEQPSAGTGIPGLGVTARVVQGVSQKFRRLVPTMPLLVVVRQGTKILRYGNASVEVHPEDMVVFPAHLAVDITNRAPRSGPYIAEMLAFDTDFVLARTAVQPASTHRQPLRRPALLARPAEGLAQAFCAAVDALTRDPPLPPAVIAHRLAEPLVWLGELLDALLLTPQTSMTAWVRSIVSADPARHWTADALARHVGASVPTLRRKLAAESTGFAEILSDVRMTTALTLIQTTTEPISDVAAAVGYASPSRFAAGFRRRFGMAPTAIRGHQRD